MKKLAKELFICSFNCIYYMNLDYVYDRNALIYFRLQF